MTDQTLELTRALRASGFFGTVTDDLLRKIVRISKLERYAKGNLIFSEGMPCTGMYIVATGAVKIYKIGPDGREHVLHVAEPGDAFGEAAIFLGGKGYPAYAGAVRKTEVAFVPKRLLIEVLDEEPGLAFQILGSLAEWTHKLVAKLELLALKDASSRLAGYIMGHASLLPNGKTELNLAIPKQTLAAQLAMSSETLSRLLTRFEAEGLIDSEGKRIHVLKPEDLGDVSEWGATEQ